MTESEKYVSELCNRSFLPFWSYPNPIGKNNKELCDVLVVCENNIIIISVKDIKTTSHNDSSIIYERWLKKAVSDSVKQIYGAEKYIQNSDEILLNDYITKIPLPEKQNRKIYRIAIAFGSDPKFPLPMGDFGRGYVSIFDEKSTVTILEELDTIIDFTRYLDAKEEVHEKAHIIAEYETDFLAFYLQTALDFEKFPNSLILDSELWETYRTSKEYDLWKEESAVSYIWDILIQYLFSNNIKSQINNKKFLELEESVRIINLEDRISRIILGEALMDAHKENVQARMINFNADKNYTYVIMPLSDKNWNFKEEELILRCDVARFLNPGIQIVIGIAIGENSEGFSFDICYLDIPELTKEFEEHAIKVQTELGYFTKPRITNHNRK